MTGSVFYRSPRHDYPKAVRAQGVYLYDAAGKQYLDGSGGAAVSTLGHGNRVVIDRVQRQIDEMAFAHTAFFTNEPQEALASALATRFPEVDAKVYFLSGGSEANEAALKLARQYWVAKGRPEKSIFISRHQSYHGNTLGTLSLSGFPGRREVYRPILMEWPKIEPCYAYRFQADGESAAEYAARCANDLERQILESGADNVAAFVAETVSGATLGAVAAEPEYFSRIREICNRHDVLLILDEVMCGSGRTGTFFAFEQENITPDIVTLAKGLGGGYLPLAAAVCRRFVHDQIVTKHGEFSHGHTYVGHATACAAGLAVQAEIDNRRLLQNVVERGRQLIASLHDAFNEHPHVGDIRGRGLFVALEFVLDKATKEPPTASLRLPGHIKNLAMENGLICYPGGGTADGENGCHVLFAPPFVFEEQHVTELVERFRRVVEALTFE